MHDAYFALGSNIEPEANLVAAVEAMAELGEVVAVSRVYDTTPVGNVRDPRFRNAVVHVTTDLDAGGCLTAARAIESRLGRVRGGDPNAPRTIDIDLVAYDLMSGAIMGKTLPSPEIWERAFVAIPLAEVAPALVVAGTGRTALQIALGFRAEAPDMVLDESASAAVALVVSDLKRSSRAASR